MNFEALRGPIGKETLNGLVFIVKQLDNGRQFRQAQQFHVPARDIYQLERATLLLNRGKIKHQHSQTGTIQRIDLFQIENQVILALAH